MKLPKGLDDPAQRERERFEIAYEVRLKGIKEISLTILVWGPGAPSASAVATKRNEIRQALEDLGHNALLSEDLPVQGRNLSEKSREFAQALAAHLIIILVEGSPGALAEAHDFCNHPSIAPNVYLMIPAEYKKGYSARGAIKTLGEGWGGVYWYREKDVVSCNLRKKAVKRAEARRAAYWYCETGHR
ncbi:MAG TPA: hypothetical protein VJX67_20630 [Blastocatellia bacterium]|nr:hypothetical protein [Blastocatellia bacterium]